MCAFRWWKNILLLSVNIKVENECIWSKKLVTITGTEGKKCALIVSQCYKSTVWTPMLRKEYRLLKNDFTIIFYIFSHF
jgi:hypothetical protein